jgi:hypothetical protein
LGLLGFGGEKTIPKILLISNPVKGEIASPNCPHFTVKIADFGLKYRIQEEIVKNSISGRKRDFLGQSLSYQVPLFPLF